LAKYLIGTGLFVLMLIVAAGCGAVSLEVVAPVSGQNSVTASESPAEAQPAVMAEKTDEAMMDEKPAETEAALTEEKAAEGESATAAQGDMTKLANPGPTEEQLKILATLPNSGPAPELQNDVWLNSEPLRLADLRGQVVIVDFWTIGSINFIRTKPAIRELHKTFKDDGLVVIGVHTPEFSYEKELAGVEESLTRLDIPFPVTLDNDKLTWRAYANHYWPAQYLIDKAGNVRALYIGEVHIGDKRYEQYKLQIEALLAENVS
jgi:hypothetical protein